MNIRVIILSSLLGVATAPNTANAEDPNPWLPVSKSSTGTVWSIRFSDLINKSNFYPQIWVKLDHSSDKSVKYRETKSLIKFDCQALKYQTLTDITYDAEGQVIDSLQYNYPSYKYAPPDSVIESTLKMACPKDEQ